MPFYRNNNIMNSDLEHFNPKPEFFIGDKVKINPEKFNEVEAADIRGETYESFFESKKYETLTIISKYKFSPASPSTKWWSGFDYSYDGYHEEIWIEDKYLIKEIDRPHYSPRKIIRESVIYYPYRFKTEKEFIEQYGHYWKRSVAWNDKGYMDYLFGKPYKDESLDFSSVEFWYGSVPVQQGHYDPIDPNRTNWTITRNMLTENEPIKPYYSPRKIVRESVKYKYTEIGYKVNNKNELKRIIDYLMIDNGYSWYDESYRNTDEVFIGIDGEQIDDLRYPTILFANLNKKSIEIYFTSMSSNFNPDIDSIVSHINSLGYDFDNNVYDENSIMDFKSIVENGMKTPSYQSRKIIRESFDDYKNKFSSIVIKVDYPTSHIEKNKLIRMTDMIISKGYTIYNFYDFDSVVDWINYKLRHKRNDWYIRLSLNNKEIITGTISLLHNNSLSGMYNYDKVYTLDDYDDIKNILTYGSSSPSYEHRKIIRESNYDYEFNSIIIEMPNYNIDTNYKIHKVAELIKMLYENGIHMRNFDDNTDPVSWVRFNIVDYSEWRYIEVDLDTMGIKLGHMRHLYQELNNNRTYDDIYTIVDIDIIRNILKYDINKPNYKPRKIIRESIEHKYEEIVYRISDREDLIIFLDLLKSLKIYVTESWYNISQFPRYVLISTGYHGIEISAAMYGGLGDNTVGEFIDDINLTEGSDTIDPYIYSKDTIYRVKSILSRGGPQPNYNPKKIIREFKEFIIKIK